MKIYWNTKEYWLSLLFLYFYKKIDVSVCNMNSHLSNTFIFKLERCISGQTVQLDLTELGLFIFYYLVKWLNLSVNSFKRSFFSLFNISIQLYTLHIRLFPFIVIFYDKPMLCSGYGLLDIHILNQFKMEIKSESFQKWKIKCSLPLLLVFNIIIKVRFRFKGKKYLSKPHIS